MLQAVNYGNFDAIGYIYDTFETQGDGSIVLTEMFKYDTMFWGDYYAKTSPKAK